MADDAEEEELWAFPLMTDAAFEEIEHLPGLGCATNWDNAHRELFARANVLGCRTERGVTLRQEMIGLLRRNPRRTQACATGMLRHVGPKSQRTVPSEALDALETECPMWFSDFQSKMMFAYTTWVSLTHGWGDWRDYNSHLPRTAPMVVTKARTIVECSLRRNTIRLFLSSKYCQSERSDYTARAMKYLEFKQYICRGHSVTGMRRVFDAVVGATEKTLPVLVLNDTVSLNASSSRAIDIFVRHELVGRICCDGSAVFTAEAGDTATFLYDAVHDAAKARDVLESAHSASHDHDVNLRVDVVKWLATPCAPAVDSLWNTIDPIDVIRYASGVMVVMAGPGMVFDEPHIRTPKLQDREEWNEVKAFVRDQFDAGDLETLAEFLVRRAAVYGMDRGRRVQVAGASDAAKNDAAVQNKYAALEDISVACIARHHNRCVVKIAKAAKMHASKKEFAAFVWRRMLTPSMIRLVHFLDVQLAMQHISPFLRAYRTRVMWETWVDDTVFPPVPRRAENKRKNREWDI